jgi:CheY-like chemotaxis protein
VSAPAKRILVVDDDESVREVFKVMLQEKGYEVATATNGFDALLKLKEVVMMSSSLTSTCRKCLDSNSCQ